MFLLHYQFCNALNFHYLCPPHDQSKDSYCCPAPFDSNQTLVYLNGSEDQVLFPFDCRIKQAFDRSEECFLLHSLQNTMDTVAMFRCVIYVSKKCFRA